jgi:hypothetical protein
MQLLRALPSSIAIFLLSAPVLAESIPNWRAPASWTSPRAAALQKIQKLRPLEAMGIEELPTGPLPLFGIAPCRIADTRSGQGFSGQAGPPVLSSNATRTFQIAGTVPGVPAQCGIPLTAQAVSFQFTIIEPSSGGNLVAWPSGPVPTISVLNWAAGIFALGNGIVVPVSATGGVNVFVNAAFGTSAQLTIDVNGYYAPASTANARTVAVDCTMGQTIQAAINREDGPLVIDVHGICNENVNVMRKDVTLRGSDPVTDGIQGVVAVPQLAALRFRYVDAGRVENLSISNGPGIGIAAVFSHLTVVNCRVTGNGGLGMGLAEGTFVDATGVTVSQNQAGANVQRGAIFFCRECDFQNNGGFAVVATFGGFLSLHDSVVTGQRGLSSSFAAYADIDCLTTTSSHPCSLQVTGQAARAGAGGTVALYGAGDFTGQLQAVDRGTVQLIGARQLATGQPGQGPTANQVDEFGTLSAGTDDVLQSQLFGTTNVSGFGRVLLRDATTLSGSIQCDSAGDAWLDPTVVAAPGSVTGCEHGPP